MTDKPADSGQRIASIVLDEKSVVRRAPEIEHERAVAIFDLIEENSFAPEGGHTGPYALTLGIEENRLVLGIGGEDGKAIDRVVLPMTSFRRVIRDYFHVCDSYFAAIRKATPSRIEAIDMGRRSLHNEGSKLLRDRLKDKVAIDDATARRLFTLICVLHVRG